MKITPETDNTSGVSFERINIPDGYTKLLGHPDCINPLTDDLDSSSDVFCDDYEYYESAHESNRIAPRINEHNVKGTLQSFISSGAGVFKHHIVSAVLGLAQLDITKLSTNYSEIRPDIFQICIEDYSAVLPPSASLMMPRDQVLSTALLPPSGALLAWFEMIEDEQV